MESKWRVVAATEDLPSYTLYDGPFQRSEQDDREYRLIRLENGLHALIIHDALADKAAACLQIAVGHLQDPLDMPGMAHFCEHMLSKGSEPFPSESDFISFITSNGGSRNASTGPAYTNYWFSIGPNHLTSGLPRLSAFFHSPLFSPSATSREINAVDSENKKNLQDDSRRIFQLGKSLSVPGHPWKKFGTGDINSLTEAAKKLDRGGCLPLAQNVDGDGGLIGREVRRRLIEWWKSEYCAGRMTLAVLGKESLDDLGNLTVNLFSPIRNLGLDSRPEINVSPWGVSEMGTIVYVKTIKDFQSFSLTFPLADQRPHFRSKPARFISHLVGHEGPGSIYAYLKNKGWIFSLNCGSQTWNRGVQTFQISGRLTEEGYLHHLDVLLVIYSYLTLLRSSNFPAYPPGEVQILSELDFRFGEKKQPHSYVMELASALAEQYPPEWTLSGASLIREWDEDVVHETLQGFIPERGRYMLMSKEHNNMVPETGWETEKWYGTQYHVRKLDPALVIKAAEPNKNIGLFLPKPNLFIPTRLEVRKGDVQEPAKYPRMIRETLFSRLWHKADDQFWLPKAQVKMDIRSPFAYATPRYAVLTRLMIDLIEDSLAEITYDAELAGLSYSLNTTDEGISVSISGYSDKLSILLRTVLDKIKCLDVDPKRLVVMMEQLRLSYKNFDLAQPTKLSNYKLSYLLTPVLWTPAEKLTELQAPLTKHDIEQHKNDILSRTYVEALVNGNFGAHAAIDIMSMVNEVLAAGSSASSRHLSQRSLILPEGANFVKQETLTDAKELNSSLTYYCQFGPIIDSKTRATLDLIVHILREPLFSQLRTKEQLGYIVSSSRWSDSGFMGLSIVIQSLKDPVFLETRVEAFINNFRQELEHWSEHDLEMQKQGLIVRKLERLRNLREETSRFWYHVQSGYYDFLRHETDVTVIRDLSLQDLLKGYDLINPTSRSRRKLSIHMYSQTLISRTPPDDTVIIESDSFFKSGLDVSQGPYPLEAAFSFLGLDEAPSSKPRL